MRFSSTPRAALGLASLLAGALFTSTASASEAEGAPPAASASEPEGAPSAEAPAMMQAIAVSAPPEVVPAAGSLEGPPPSMDEPAGPAAARSPIIEPDKLPTSSRYTARGLLGPVRAGPTVGVGVPDGVRFGVFAKWLGVLGAGAAFSLLPPTTVPGVDVRVVRASGEVFARVHPLQGAFFVGVAGGYAQTKGTMIEQTTYFRQSQRVVTDAYARAVYVAPQLGFQWMLPLGLTAGFDVGVEIPVATTGPTFDATRYGLVVPIDVKGKVADATRYVTTMPVPVVHLIEVGYAL